MSLKRPSEIIAEHPEIKKVWTPNVIGYLFTFGLVRGKKEHRGCRVDEKDVLKIFRLRESIAIDSRL